MATPPKVDVEMLLATLPADRRADREGAREAARFEINQVLRSGVGDQAAAGPRAASNADLDRVIERSQSCLTNDAKDLVIAAWLAEALTQRFGFAGLRDGLTLMRRLIVDCWEDCIPRPGRDGDLELRARPLESLASERYLLSHLRRSCLTDPASGAEPFSAYDLLKRRTGGQEVAPTEAEVTNGPIGEAVSRSSRGFYECLFDDLNEAAEADRALRKDVSRRFADDAPDLRSIGRAVQDCRQVLELILAVKRRQEPVPPSDSQPAGAGGAEGAAQPGPFAAAGSQSQAFVPGPTSALLERGHALIGFLEQARALAEAAAKLKENRERYEVLKEEIKKLDAEFEEIADRIARDNDYEPLLARRLGLHDHPKAEN